MSQLYGAWAFQRDNDDTRTELRLYVTPGSRRPYDAARIAINSRGVTSFPKRASFDTPWSALQFMRERRGELLKDGWEQIDAEGLAVGVDLADLDATLNIPVIATTAFDGCWTYRLDKENAIAQLRVRVATSESSPYTASSHEFDQNMEPCPVLDRVERHSRKSMIMAYLRTEARAFDRQGWTLVSQVGLAAGVDLLDESKDLDLPEAHLATQEATWEYRDTLTGEGRLLMMLVHTDRLLPFELGHFKRRPGTTPWYGEQHPRHFEDMAGAMRVLRNQARHLVKGGFVLSQVAGLAVGIDPTDEHQAIPIKGFPKVDLEDEFELGTERSWMRAAG